MPYQEPLKKGQEVFVRRPIQVYATVIGPRDFGAPDGTDVYCVQLQPLKQYYSSEDLEPSLKQESKTVTRMDLFKSAEEIQERITKRAYELFESRGRAHGHDREDWIRAQSEILMNVPVEIRETESDLTILADVPGFSEENLQVQVAPDSLCIAGRRPEGLEMKGWAAVFSERRSNQIFRVLKLPSQVDPASVDLTLDSGILEIRLLKAVQDRKLIVFSKGAAA